MNIIAGIVILLLACIGNAELWVILMNRRHALRYGHQVLHRVRRFHDAGMVFFPLFLLTFAGLSNHGLLRGGTFSDLQPAMQGIVLIACCGLVPLCASTIRWHMSHQPPRLRQSTSKILYPLEEATSEEQRQRVIGDTSGLLWRLPGNQVYQLDVNRKRLTARPAEASQSVDGRVLKLAHFSDVHVIGCPGQGYHEFVTEQLCALCPDAFVFTGDLLDRMELLPWAIESFERMAAIAPGYFILGNHDWIMEADEIRAALISTGWIDLGEKSVMTTLNGIEVLLAGTEAPWIGDNPRVPERITESLRILLSHSPDQRDFGVAQGFDAMLCGHNHGGQVRLPIIGPVYSPSKYGVRYSGGVYEHGEMLIHVSRGVGAMDALRWNCRPEITLLEFEC
jgi:uncharacterized protein